MHYSSPTNGKDFDHGTLGITPRRRLSDLLSVDQRDTVILAIAIGLLFFFDALLSAGAYVAAGLCGLCVLLGIMIGLLLRFWPN
jgi:hypothetical protein